MNSYLLGGLIVAMGAMIQFGQIMGAAEQEREEVRSPPRRQEGGLVREPECRRIFEELFRRPFKKVRPDFLKNPLATGPNKTHQNLELDGYDGQRLAFEHHGKQHYEFPNAFHKTEKDFEYQLQKDDFRRRRCRALGIVLIEIPYSVKFADLKKYIIEELSKRKIAIPRLRKG